MITIQLQGQQEKVAADNPWGLKLPPLYHQWRTFQALQERHTWLVANTYNTGTGKTRASLLHLLTLDKEPVAQKNVLFVAPTNALLRQHCDDIQKFVTDQKLDYHVQLVTAAENRALKAEIEAQGHYNQVRGGETLYRFLRNLREFSPDATRRQGLVLVVNPDIFYYALMFQYATHDQRNLFQEFLHSFRYIVIDEFHYYDQKQLAFFLFFFAISKELGYFEHAGRKICLLSATPHPRVIEYLQGIFDTHWQLISPDNEPPESDLLATVPTLTPLTLTFLNDNLVDWGKQNGRFLQQQLNDHQLDGAIISDSLRRINQLEFALRPLLGDKLGRITGPEPENKRQIATAQQLILATPTVDIGYNFDKADKKRQNIDFLITEARFGDDLVQRIGRAGRILPKSIKDRPSQATVLLRDELLDVLRPYHQQTLTRAEFSQIVRDNMPPKHDLWQYIRSWGITEVFYPIYQVHRLSLEDAQTQLEELYQTLYRLFETRQEKTSFYQLSKFFRAHYYREKWVTDTKDKPIPRNRETAEQMAAYIAFHGDEQYEAADIQPHLNHPNLLGMPEKETALRYFVASRSQLTKSLFNFRDSFAAGTAVISDPDNLLSTEAINSHDLLHVAANFHVHWFENRADFVHNCGSTELSGQEYGLIRSHRQPHLTFDLTLDARSYPALAERETFEQYWACRPVAVEGFQLQATAKGVPEMLSERISNSLADKFIPILILPRDLQGKAIRYLKQTTLYGYKLTVTFEGSEQVEYLAYLGKAAWLAHAELRNAIRLRERLQSTAIIC